MTDVLLAKRISEQASQVSIGLSQPEARLLADYCELLARWNARINLTSLPLDSFPPQSVDKLIIEPLAIGPLIGAARRRWVDIGSGGGSPAIPLKIVCPSLALSMVESRSRKAAFLQEVIRALGLTTAKVLNGRVEDFAKQPALLKKFDLVTVRAVRLTPDLVVSVSALLEPGGELALFGPEPAHQDGLARRLVLSRTTDIRLSSGATTVHWYVKQWDS